MGFVRVKGIIGNLTDRSKRAEIEFIADTGAMLTIVPGEMLNKLDIKPKAERKFRLADGEMKKLPVGDALVEIEGMELFENVVFGGSDAPPLLGVTTLERLGLEVDPTTGKLKPMELMLL